jgi:hypothetical protein
VTRQAREKRPLARTSAGRVAHPAIACKLVAASWVAAGSLAHGYSNACRVGPVGFEVKNKIMTVLINCASTWAVNYIIYRFKIKTK